ncbi:MAG: DegT/DnrJ/EryC1/StrS family aminotransferase [Actinomycetota bacterium]|nr:DegT/DnrJ/EryC1/StrS family aminotransferase [Actinomycetota bacterium]
MIEGSRQINSVPFIDVSRQYLLFKDEIDEAIRRVLDSGCYILGEEVQMLEREMASFVGVRHAVGVASGTDALFLILKAMGIGQGDEVITTPFTFVATASTISHTGAIPVFADIDPETFNIDPDSVKSCLTERTKAVVAVHLFGHPADMRELSHFASEHDLFLIEDCAQATGASLDGKRVGSIGHASAFSFFPTKNLSCAGDGGIVCTASDDLADRVRVLARHGMRERDRVEVLGYNSRLDEIQAAILRVKLKHIDELNSQRHLIADIYNESLRGVEVPVVRDGATHVHSLYTIRTKERPSAQRKLSSSSIGFGIYYPVPLHLQKAFSFLGYSEGDLPESEKASREVLSLPMFAGMTEEEAEFVCSCLNS